MGLFEFLGESRNPGPVGQMDIGRPGRRGGDYTWVRALIAAAALAAWTVFLWRRASGPDEFLLWLALSTLYVVAAYSLRPAPDYSNVGFLGGLIDHPFRYSDDVNRWLAVLAAVLWPGRFIGSALVDVLAGPRADGR